MKITIDSNLLLIMELIKLNPTISNIALGSLPKEELDQLVAGAKLAATSMAELTTIGESTAIDAQIALMPKLIQLEEAKGELSLAQAKNGIISNIGKSTISNTQQYSHSSTRS